MEVETIKKEVGVSWKFEKLSSISEILMGQSPEGNSYNNKGIGLPLLNGAADYKGDKFTPKKFTTSPTKIAIKGDILLGIRATIGNLAISNTDYCIGRGLAAIRVNESKAHIGFVLHFLSEQIGKLSSEAAGSTIKGIVKEDLFDMLIPLPPLTTQKRIAEILDAADALKRKDQELLKKYDELAQAIFIDMFGDPVKNEKGWEKVKMEKLMTIVRGGSPRPIDKFLGGKYPWIKIGDATKGDDVYLNSTREHIIEEGLSKTRLLPAGSLIFANCGVSLGFARIITFEGCIHDGWLAFSDFDDLKINKIFLLKALNSITQYFRDSAPEGTQPNLNTSIIKDFELILPPMSLQNKFELILSSFKGIKENAECNFKNSNHLFDSIIQKAFKGELVA